MEMLIKNETLNDGIYASVMEGTFHYKASLSDGEGFRVDGVFGSYIEFDCFTTNGFTASTGDALSCGQRVYVDEDFVDIYPSYRDFSNFPYFYVKKVSVSRGITHIIAYDAITMLDVDYSQRMKALESSFPMSVSDLFDDVVAFAGLTHNINWALRSPSIAVSMVSYFYVPDVTARQMVFWIASLFGCRILATGQTSIVETSIFGSRSGKAGWKSDSLYILSPNNEQHYQPSGYVAVTNAQYKQSGFDIEAFIPKYDGVDVLTTYGNVYSYFHPVDPPTNVYYVKNNPIVDVLTYSPNGDVNDIAFGIYGTLSNNLASYFNVNVIGGSVKLFPFMNPYLIGERAYAMAYDGSKYFLPITSIDMTDDEVVIYSNVSGDVGAYNDDYKPIAVASQSLLDLVYPVGSIYMSTQNVDPGTIIGGTWSRIEGRFILAAADQNGSESDNTYFNRTAGSSGGERNHQLTTGELPSHTHGSKTLTGSISFRKVGTSPSAIYGAVSGIFSQANNDTNKYETLTQLDSTKRQSQKLTVNATHTHDSVGSGTSHNNIPPYISVYTWERTA